MVEDKFIKNIYIKYITEKSADSTFCLSVVKKKKTVCFRTLWRCTFKASKMAKERPTQVVNVPFLESHVHETCVVLNRVTWRVFRSPLSPVKYHLPSNIISLTWKQICFNSLRCGRVLVFVVACAVQLPRWSRLFFNRRHLCEYEVTWDYQVALMQSQLGGDNSIKATRKTNTICWKSHYRIKTWTLYMK